MKNYWTKNMCDEIINEYKNNTAYFGNNSIVSDDYIDGNITYKAMYNMLRHRMLFGEAETKVIIASLIKCGAKIV